MFEAFPNNSSPDDNFESIEFAENSGELIDKTPLEGAISSLIDDISGSEGISVEQVLHIWDLNDENKNLLIRGFDLSQFAEMGEEERENLKKLQDEGKSHIRALKEAANFQKAA